MSAGKTSGRGVAALLGLLVALLTLPAVSAAAPDPAAEIYDPGRMYVVELGLEKPAIDGLWADRDKYQPGTLRIAGSDDGTPEGTGAFSAPIGIKVKLKGSASFRPLSGKSAFKLKFDTPFLGLKHMTLNNMVEDPSMIHETLAYTAYREAEVPASRTGYAYVYVNGVDYGIHLNIETLDKVALEKLFGAFDEDTQHLYEGEGGADVYPFQEEEFEVDVGDEDDLSDLTNLIAAVHSSGPLSWAQRVAAVADLQEMTRMWAVEKYIGQWDGYAGQEELWTPNNYYLYSDPDGRFQMLPWGNDETWQEAYHLPFDGRAGAMFDRCLDDDAACLAVYRQSVAAVRDAIAGSSLDALAVDSAALLRPWQEMEAVESTREEWGCEEIQAGVAETLAFVASRGAEAAQWLGEPSPKPGPRPGPGPGVCAGSQQDGFPAGASVADQRIGSSGPGLRVARAWAAKGVLRARMHLPASGVVTLRGTISTGKGTLVVCRDRLRVKHARVVTLRCGLPASVRRRLRQRSLGIKITTHFLPDRGVPERVTRRITLPRTS